MEYAVGIDLHGTLMEDKEYIREDLKNQLITALNAVKGFCSFYVATGNDLMFVKRKIPDDVLSIFDSLILETGCVLSDGEAEEVLVSGDICDKIRKFEDELKGLRWEWVYKFDRRLTSIAAFTKYGFSPGECSRDVCGKVVDAGLKGICYVTYSSVAVDVVPNGFSKLTGLKHVAGDLKTIGIADSMNDIQLHLGTDISFAPSNISPELEKKIAESGRTLMKLSDADELVDNITYVASYPATEGVIEVLDFLSASQPP
ncbi:MAG: hypothetical protein KKD39_01350 [Candidatus Altiarchaeota archaeon]|nr:hypothetical protein [Candidatus Altiarchaeota archaeon]